MAGFVETTHNTATFISVLVGDYRRSHINGEHVVCSGHQHLEYISNLIVCKTIDKGRYLTIIRDTNHLLTQDDSDFLLLCQVEIYGKGKVFEKKITKSLVSCLFFCVHPLSRNVLPHQSHFTDTDTDTDNFLLSPLVFTL